MIKPFPSDRIGRDSMKKRKSEICRWKEDSEGWWGGSCGIRWCFDDGTPTENDVCYCPKCGKWMVEESESEKAEG